MNYMKYIMSAVGGVVLAYFRLYGFAFAIVGASVLFDMMTGVIAAIATGEGLSSKKAFKGVMKKLMLLIALGFGTFLDVLLPYAANTVSIPVPKNLLFSTVICVYIALTESISIIENIYKCNSLALPGWISKLLESAKKDMDEKGGKFDD